MAFPGKTIYPIATASANRRPHLSGQSFEIRCSRPDQKLGVNPVAEVSPGLLRRERDRVPWPWIGPATTC